MRPLGLLKGFFMKKYIASLLIVLSASSLSGCLVMAAGAGVGAWKAGSAQQKKADAENRKMYNEYVRDMQRVNIDRQKVGLQPERILTPEEYLSQSKSK